ncbi:MAG TPA: T9SS type A sorting domain-containing protein, partial [Saprospiraceae bacterium]|nr:T9SS type A sorting domain-containing protein [Saprospiraceae bacterium]
ITNWQCHGIKIHDNTFNDIQEDCIYTIDGSFDITSNEFNSLERGIHFLRTYVTNYSEIEGNTFNAQIGILNDGNSFTYTDVEDNIFNCESSGVKLQGASNFEIEHNEFPNAYYAVGVKSIASGGLFPNEIEANQFTNNTTGIAVDGNSSGLVFERNCFSSSNFADVNINLAATIREDQGSSTQEAGNCFSNGGNPQSSIKSIDDGSGIPNSFTYYIYPDGETNCKDLGFFSGNFNIGNSANSADNSNCGTTTGSSDRLNSKSLTELLSLQGQLQTHLNALNGGPGTAYTEGKLQAVHGAIIQKYMDSGQSTQAIAELNPSANLGDAMMLFSIYMQESNYGAAQTALNAIPASNTELMDFHWVQNMNLQRLQHGPNYSPTASQISALKSIAEKRDPLAAYARSLYFALTGERVFLEYDPVPSDSRAVDQSINEANSVKIYPNPSMDNFMIDLGGHDAGANIKVFDSYGRMVVEQQTEKQQIELATQQWESGIYFLEIRSENAILTRDKLILTK